jgi:hypothetical protein
MTPKLHWYSPYYRASKAGNCKWRKGLIATPIDYMFFYGYWCLFFVSCPLKLNELAHRKVVEKSNRHFPFIFFSLSLSLAVPFCSSYISIFDECSAAAQHTCTLLLLHYNHSTLFEPACSVASKQASGVDNTMAFTAAGIPSRGIKDSPERQRPGNEVQIASSVGCVCYNGSQLARVAAAVWCKQHKISLNFSLIEFCCCRTSL